MQEAEVVRQRDLVKNIVFPFLVANTKSVVEAKRLCYEVQTTITQGFQKIVAEKQKELSEDLTSKIPMEDITKRGEGFKVNKALYDLLAGEKLNVTNALLGGMGNALDSFVNEEMASRHLNSLKTTFL